MRVIRLAINVILMTLILAACVNKQEVFITTNPTIKEMLTPNSDIFLWNDAVYLTDIAWLNELVLTEHELIGTILTVSTDSQAFTHGTANKLNVGAEIYTANERGGVLIVKDGNVTKYYLKLVEG